MRLYVSGPMTGIVDFNYPAFAAATSKLRDAGHDVVDPSEALGGEQGHSWEEYLRKDLADVLTVDGVALLQGWQGSRGARLEVFVAGEVGIRCFPWEEWLGVAP